MSNVPKGIAANDVPPLQFFFVDNGPCPKGPPGPTGPTGPIGFSGLGQGATGATGASGPPGTVGATGPQGAQGSTGVQGAQGSPFLGIGQTGLAGPPGATGVRGVAGGVTIPGDPYGVVFGSNTNNGIASSNITYSNSTLNFKNGTLSVNSDILWRNTFGSPQTASASGNNSSAPLPSTPLISLSLNIVNPSTGYSLMDYPAVFCSANMLIRNTLEQPVSPTTLAINSTMFYMNNIPVGTMTQYSTCFLNPDVKLYQTRQFIGILYRGVDYSAGGVSNIQFNCSRVVVNGADSSNTALGTWTANMTVFGLYQ